MVVKPVASLRRQKALFYMEPTWLGKTTTTTDLALQNPSVLLWRGEERSVVLCCVWEHAHGQTHTVNVGINDALTKPLFSAPHHEKETLRADMSLRKGDALELRERATHWFYSGPYGAKIWNSRLDFCYYYFIPELWLLCLCVISLFYTSHADWASCKHVFIDFIQCTQWFYTVYTTVFQWMIADLLDSDKALFSSDAESV